QPVQYSSPQPQETDQQASRPVDNSTLTGGDSATGAPVRSSGFLGAAQPLPGGVLESSEPVSAAPAAASAAAVSTPAAAAASQPAASSTGGNYVVQVGALKDGPRAQALATSLGKQFGVPGSVESSGNVYRVQLGRFTSRQQAAALQQRLASEAQQQSFITVAPGSM
ncbi:MAG TPA: septal ring lytic transglycosylase RlpA, partial [Erwinia persicina]|nr:septal ring lytic transglycosylase RlpA [Erwinia persicina]